MSDKKPAPLSEWMHDAVAAEPRGFMAGVLQDARNGISPSASMIPDRMRAEEKPRTPSSGTVPIQQPPGIAIIDAMCDAADRQDRINAIRQRVENEWIESHFQKGPRVAREYHPLRQYDSEVPSLHREKP